MTDGRLYPDDVTITDSDGAFGSWRHPLVLTIGEFLDLFDNMAVAAEKLLKYRALVVERDGGDIPNEESLLRELSKLDFSSMRSDRDSDAMSLYFKMQRLEHGYHVRFNETCKKHGNRSKWQDRITGWSMKMHALYRGLLLEKVI